MKKIYIADKVTGLELLEARAWFDQAQRRLEADGFQVFNPMELTPNSSEDKEWHWYMRADIKHLLECDAIYMLANWHTSEGADLERHIAKRLGMDVIYEVDYVSGIKH